MALEVCIVLLKLTDGQEASSGLSATTELLVNVCQSLQLVMTDNFTATLKTITIIIIFYLT